MNAIEALIFDMDGLMIDSERLYFQVERDIAGRYDKEVPDEVLWKMMGRSPRESLKIFIEELELPLSVEEALDMRDQQMRKKLHDDLVPMPGLKHIIDTFYRHKKLAIATGAQQEFLDIVVDQLGIRHQFTVLQTSDHISRGKPDPEIYLATCEKLACQPAQCVVLEDSSNGALAGKKAGCYVVAVPNEYTNGQDFSFADCIARDLDEAREHILDLANV